jgi:hypothetical protein
VNRTGITIPAVNADLSPSPVRFRIGGGHRCRLAVLADAHVIGGGAGSRRLDAKIGRFVVDEIICEIFRADLADQIRERGTRRHRQY